MNQKQIKRSPSKIRTANWVFLLVALHITTLSHADTIRIVAKYQTAVPSNPNTSIYQVLGFSGAEAPIISRTGKVFFKAKLQGVGATGFGGNAIFVEDTPGQLRLLARGLDAIAAPGSSDATFQDFSNLQISENGRLLFRSRISATGATSSNDLLLCIADAGAPQCVVRKGQEDVGTFSEELPQDGNDLLSFKSQTFSTPIALRAWNSTIGAASIIAQVNALAPGTGGANFGPSIARLYTRGLSSHLISSGLSGTGVTTSNDSGLWTGTTGNLMLVAREGGAVPGRPGSTFTSLFESSRPPVFSKAGIVAFTGGISGADLASGVFRFRAGQLQPLVFSGDSAATELGDGVIFSSLSPTGLAKNIHLADDVFGTLFLVAEVAGPGINTSNNRTIWRFGPQGRELIARGGQEISPGLQLVNSTLGAAIRTNSSQEIALRANLTGPALPQGLTSVVSILRTAGQVLHVLARDGASTAVVAGQTYRIVSAIWNTTLQFNELGQVLFSGTATKDPLDISGTPAIIVADQNRQLHLVAGHTEFFQAEPSGELLRLASYSYSESAALSDSGDVVFASGISTGANGNNAVLRHTIEASAPCLGDFNNDDAVTSQDIFDFLQAFFTQAMIADIDGTGEVTVQDLFAFLENFYSGCP